MLIFHKKEKQLYNYIIISGMNRYESAYRDYTIPRAAGGDESSLYPQRPERTVKTTGAAGRFITRGHANEVSSDETSDSYERRMIQNHNQAASGFSTDEESFANIQQNPRQIVSSRELSDRNNPDFLVPNDAIQTYRQHLQQRYIYNIILHYIKRGRRPLCIYSYS